MKDEELILEMIFPYMSNVGGSFKVMRHPIDIKSSVIYFDAL